MGNTNTVIEQTNGFAPTSLEAWNTYNTQTIQLTDKLAVEIAGFDVVAMLVAGKNPILGVIQDLVERDAEGKPQLDSLNEANLIDQPEKLAALSSALDEFLIDIMINPRLKEQGHEDGYPVNRIPFNFKMQIFEVASGGVNALEAPGRFHQEQGASLVVAPNGAGVRAEAE